MPNFSGKALLVIGGETPLGKALAVGLAESGASVAIASLSKETKAEFAINSALNELWALGRKGAALAIDASSEQELTDALERSESDLGPLDLTAVVAPEGVVVDTKALSGRKVVEISPDTAIEDAIAAIATAL